jgi:hypothetical protein
MQVCIYCTLLPLRESGAQLPAAVTKFMDTVSGLAAVKAGTEQVGRSHNILTRPAADRHTALPDCSQQVWVIDSSWVLGLVAVRQEWAYSPLVA